jgi:hypothetical protein
MPSVPTAWVLWPLPLTVSPVPAIVAFETVFEPSYSKY